MKKKLLTLMTLLLAVSSGVWGTDIVWTFKSTDIKNSADFSGSGSNTFIADNGSSELIFKGNNNNNDKLQAISATISVGGQSVSYTSEVVASGNFGSSRYFRLPTLSGAGTITVVTGSVCANRTIYLNTSTSIEGTTIASSATTNTAYSQSVTLNGESTYYIIASGKMNVVSIIWSPATIDTASPTCTTSQTTESATIGTPLNLTVTPAHYTSLQWYKATASNLSDAEAIGGATSATYAYTAAKADANQTYYFYCVATNVNATGTKTAQSSTITVNVGSYVASTACKLYQAKYSNGFNAFINESAKTVNVYYLEGQSAPTVNSLSLDLSDDATADYSDGSKIIVTAEDGTTTATYNVTKTAVTPFSGALKQFNGTESWVKTGNSYFDINSDKVYHAWVINRQLKDNESRDTDERVALGKTRIYFFVDNATSITLTNYGGSALSAARAIKVYVNGTLQDSPTSMPAYNADGSAAITITTGAAAMVEISSDQNSGDTGWGRITVTGAQQNKEAISTLSGRNYGSYITTNKLDFSSASGITAYIATGLNGNSDAVVLQSVNVVPASTPIIVKTTTQGATVDVPVTANDEDDVSTNLLVAGDNTTNYNGTSGYVYYYLASDLFHQATSGKLQKGKAYLKVAGSLSARNLDIVFDDGETTGISDVRSQEADVRGEFYNLKGQKVAQPRKGLYIVNGRKVVIK